MGGEVDRDLVAELAQIALLHAAPEELAIFDETATEFFADPDAVLSPKHRDEPVGFGLDVALLTPYVLAVAIPVVQFLTKTVVDAAKEETRSVITNLVRRLFRRVDNPSEAAAPPPPVTLTVGQVKQVRQIAYEKALALGLPTSTASLLADSVGGGVLATG